MSVRYLSTAEAAKVLGIGETAMRDIVNSGGLPHSNIGSDKRPRIRIREDDLHGYMASRTRNIPQDGAA